MSRNTFRIATWTSSNRLGPGRPSREGRNSSRRLRPALVELEGRRLLAMFTVSNTDASGAGTLAAAIASADTNNQANTISFEPSVFNTPQTIILGGSQLELSDTGGLQTITGPAAGVTVSGGGTSGVFQVDNGVTAAFFGLTISDGSATGSSGGGLENEGIASLTDCTLSGNSAQFGGAVDNNGTGHLTLVDCTLSGNSAQVHGGGLDNGSAATLVLDDCTISGNTAATAGGGLNNFGAATLTSTIVASNTSSSDASDIEGDGTVSGTYNLIGTGGAGALTNGHDHNIVLASLSNLGLAPLGLTAGQSRPWRSCPAARRSARGWRSQE
jgi:hypothetical protein